MHLNSFQHKIKTVCRTNCMFLCLDQDSVKGLCVTPGKETVSLDASHHKDEIWGCQVCGGNIALHPFGRDHICS